LGSCLVCIEVSSSQLIVEDGKYITYPDRAGTIDNRAHDNQKEVLSLAEVTTPFATPVEDLSQYKTSSDLQNFNGLALVNDEAFYTWYSVAQTTDLAGGGATNDGSRVTVRATSPSGVKSELYMTWSKPGWCWQPSNGAACLNYSAIIYSVNANQVLGNWNFEVLFYDAFTEESIYTKDFHIVGHTLESAGNVVISGQIDTVAKSPIKVKLVDYDGASGVSGQPVTFTINSTNGSDLLSSYSSQSRGSNSLTVTTNTSGIAEVFVSLGSTEGSSTVSVSSSTAPINLPYFGGAPVFTANALLDYVPDYEIPELEEEKNLGEIKKGGGCAGNPINIITGNKFQKEIDFTGTSASPLIFTRYYNALDLNTGTMGAWRHNYELSVTEISEGRGPSATITALVTRADGRVLAFNDNGGQWLSDADVKDRLISVGRGWELHTERDTVETYSSQGRLLSVSDSRGNIQALVYRGSVLEGVVSNSNEELAFTYDRDGHLVNIDFLASNPDPVVTQSRSWTYGYIDDNLTSVTNPDGSQRIYHYEDIYNPWSLTGITDERGERYATWVYDLFGYATTSYHGIDAERVDINYDLSGVRIVTDSLGNETTYSTMAQIGSGLVSDRNGPTCSAGDSSIATYTYDPATNDKLSQTIDGTTTQYGDYDLNGNPGYQIEAVGTPSERRTDYTYDSRFHSKITSITEPSVHTGESKVTTMEYDEFGNLIRRTVDGFKPDGTPVSRTVTFEYNGPYHQLSQIDGPRTDVSDITTFEYYADDPALYQHQGMLLRVTGPEGIVLRDNLQYNGQRQLISETRPNGLVVTYDWEPNTDRLAAITETVDADSRTSSWTYLLSGEVETFTQADGSTLSYEYDEARRLVRIVDALGNYIDYNLDTEGNILNESIYDPNDILAKSITRSFDVYNRLDVMTQANESLDYDYAADGTLAKEVNGNAIETQYSYDELKRLTTTMGDANGTDPDTAASQTDLDYDSQDNLAAVTDPLASVTTYTYDDLGNRVGRVSPDTGTATFIYDDAGNRIQTTDAKGQTFTFSYDARNRLTFSDAPGSDHDIQYTYDSCANGVGKLCSLSRGANSPQFNTTQYAYNGFGDVVSMDQDVQTDTALVGASLGITYDAAGRIQSITYPGNTSITYGYDLTGNVNQLTLDRGGLVTELINNVTYEPFGPLKALTLGNGLARSIDHDQAYRITAINDPVYDVAFSYDANGNILYQSRNVGDLSTGYDTLDKLTTATGSLDSYAYSYDRNANRLTDTLNGTLTGYNYEPLSNRLTQVGLDPVILDANGNTTQLRGMTLDYSPDNRLIAANDSTYSYNGIGERVLKTDISKTTVYQYGLRGQLMAELNDSGQVEKAYIYFNSQPFAVLDYATDPAGALYYIHGDHLGTPQGLTNQSGSIVWLADYSLFGLAVVNDDPDLDGNPVTFNLRFAGQYFDGESGFHYNYFRDYDPSTGRYVQSDPIGLDAGLNTYGYVGGNPLVYIDPYGLRLRPGRGFGSGGTNGGAGGIFGQTIGNGYTQSNGRYIPPSIPSYRPVPIIPRSVRDLLAPNNTAQQEFLRRFFELFEHLLSDVVKEKMQCQLNPEQCGEDESEEFCPIGS
jgi:RHS repeat-associated protein